MKPPTEDWRTDAACGTTDAEAWFPHPSENASAALAVCHSCPVRQQCLDFAMREEERSPYRYGIYGGLTAAARTKLARRMREAS